MTLLYIQTRKWNSSEYSLHSSNMFITLLVVLAGVTLSAAECPECTCFSVNQTQVNLYEVSDDNLLIQTGQTALPLNT